jgi:tRNA(fMet)-specific endonuclease VapC
MSYFLDTNTCIYFLKGMYPNIRTQLQSKRPLDIKIPAIVKAELLFGAERSQHVKQNTQRVMDFLIPYETVPFASDDAEIYAKIRSALQMQGSPIGANDLIIAATVMEHQGTLVTNNLSEFKRVKHLKLENWV